MQAVEFDLIPGDRVFAQPGTYVCGSGGVTLDVEWGKSLLDPVRRIWSGEKGTLLELRTEDSPGRVVIGASQVGRVVHLRLDGTKSYFCERGAYLAHTGEIDISVGFTRKFRAGLFGGQGFMMQRISGYGDVFLQATGSIVDWQLDPEATVTANTLNLLAFEDSVGYDIQFVGGLFSVFFAGQGLFLAKLKGPGQVVCHSINPMALAKNMKMAGSMPLPSQQANASKSPKPK